MAKSRKRVGRNGDKALPALPKKLKFDYIKSNCFRVIRVDGVHGGVTPRGDGIQLALFSERRPIPTSEEYAVVANGKIGSRTDVEQRNAVVREVEVEAICSVEVAMKLEEWIHDKIRQIKDLQRKVIRNG